MEKIKRYISSPGFHKGSNLEHPDGQLCLYEDHIANMKKIFPDWPGEYPTEDGWYYFDHGVGDISLVYAIYEYGKFYRPALDLEVKFVDVDKVQFGPRVPMWRKI